MRSLTELSLNISEEMYRELPQLSYSTLARYEKGGFSSISKLFEEIQPTDSIIFGSAVDTMITEGFNKFTDKFYVADFELPSDTLVAITNMLLATRQEKDFDEVPDSSILDACNELKYSANLKDNTRVEKVRKECTKLYNIKKESEGKIIISSSVYNNVLYTVNALKDGPISKYLQPKSEGGKIEFLYQQKFTTTLDGLDVKMMADLLVVNHDMKMIIPIDLKTTGMPEYYFPQRYLDNRYDIQAKLYWHILRDVLDKDDYFKDFKLLNFRFIVVNKNTLTPLMFEDDRCTEMGENEITFKSGRKLILRDPITIGKELKHYLDTAATLPDGFTQDKPVNIYEILTNE